MEELESSRTSSLSSLPFLSWDSFCNLLDGLAWDTGQYSLVLQEELKKPGQYFFPPSSSQHASEIFWLKLFLFERLCRQVALYHERIRQPLLLLDAQQVGVVLTESNLGYVPVRWRSDIQLPLRDAEPSSNPEAMLLIQEGMPLEMAEALTTVPSDIDTAYLSPLVRAWPRGREVRGTALIISIDPILEEGNLGIRGLLRIHLITDEIVARDFSNQDVFCIMFPQVLADAGVRFWGRKVEEPERGIVLSGVTECVSSEVWRELEAKRQEVISAAKGTIYRSYSSVHDIYSLGMLLLRALWGSNSTQWNGVLTLLPDLVDGLSPAVQGMETSDSHMMHVRVKEYLSGRIDCQAPSTISGDLWWDAILIGMRAVSRIQDFSYTLAIEGTPGPFEKTPLEILRHDVMHVAHRARIDLFEAAERDAAILTVCGSALDELGMT